MDAWQLLFLTVVTAPAAQHQVHLVTSFSWPMTALIRPVPVEVKVPVLQPADALNLAGCATALGSWETAAETRVARSTKDDFAVFDISAPACS
jgi:hypothetical protein